jgi:transcriptional regulator with XRE-family HTH domain
MKFSDVGQQLRAYRMESGMRAEEIAARLGVSRAALYRYEKGEVIKLETIRRLAELLKVSPLALLGIGIEYFVRPAALQERVRGLEEQAEQILVVGGAVHYPLTTEAYDSALGDVWEQSAPTGPERAAALAGIEQALSTLAARKRAHAARRPSTIVVLSESALRQFLVEGVAAAVPATEALRQRCRRVAADEAEALAELLEAVPIGLQIGLVPAGAVLSNFVILRSRDRANLVTNPLAPDAHPMAVGGVSGITAADDAVLAHQRVAESLWRDALKGAEAAARVRELARHALAGAEG